MPGRHLVIVNPHASHVRDRAQRRRLLDELRSVLERHDGAAPEVIETQRPEDTRPAVREGLAGGVSGVVGVGGDGMLRGIAAALTGSGVPLGVIPAGTGNQLAAALGIPLDTGKAVTALAGAQPRSIDLGEVTVRPVEGTALSDVFAIGCGAGLDARLMATTPPSWKQRAGSAAYFAQALRLIPSLSAQPYRITVDGQIIELEATIALVGNMGQLVPGLLSPRLPLVPDDGLLDLIVVGASNVLHGAKGLGDQVWRTELGGGSGSDSVRLRGTHITIEPERPEAIEVDGDYIGEGSFEARVAPAAVEVLVPAR